MRRRRTFYDLLHQPVPDPNPSRSDAADRAYMRKAAAQALVADAFRNTVAAQDETRRRLPDFNQAWKTRLAALLNQAVVVIAGWSELHIPSDVDVDFAWKLFTEAAKARQHTIDHATITRSRKYRLSARDEFQTYRFTVRSDESDLGEVKYSVCQPCQVGLLRNIEFPPDWQFCGLGTRSLRELEARHSDLDWYTTGQHGWARSFYDQYREHSQNLWIQLQRPCPHFR